MKHCTCWPNCLTISEPMSVAERQAGAHAANLGEPSAADRINQLRAQSGREPLPVVEAGKSPSNAWDDIHAITDGLSVAPTGAVRSKDADPFAYELISPVAMIEMAEFFAEHTLEWHGVARHHYNAAINECWWFLGTGDADYLRRAIAELALGIQAEREPDVTLPAVVISDSGLRFDRFPPAAMKALARRYRLGAKKYSYYNCEKGLDVPCFMNHGLKHLYDLVAGQPEPDAPDGGDNAGAALWNLVMALHSGIKWPHLNQGKLRRGDCVPPSVAEDSPKGWGPYFVA